MKAVAMLLCLGALSVAQPKTRDQWVEWARAGFEAAPEPRGALLVEMLPLLESPDPVLRDEVAYAAAERWILREPRLTDEQLHAVVPQWRRILRGEADGGARPGVLPRSFAALCLSLAAARDLSAPFLQPAEVHELLVEALDYFAAEQDLRGFDPATGWVHALAHTSDLVKFLARNSRLPSADHARIIDVIGTRLGTVDSVFVWGEDERIGLALHSLVRRPDFDVALLDAWLSRWVALHQDLWAGGPGIDPARYARVQNTKSVLRSLLAALSMETAASAQVDTARARVVAALAKMR